MKKLTCLALAGALSLSMAVPALAAAQKTLTVNGAKVDVSKLPVADGIPMRAFVESDGGSAEWYPEDNCSLFFIDGSSVMVEFATGNITVDGQTFQGGKAVEGVTYIPVKAVEAMNGVSVTETASGYTITTPSSDPLVKLAKDILEKAGMAAGMKASASEMEAYYGIRSASFESVVGYFPMMVNADTVIIGKVNSGKMADAKADLEARKAATIQNFENYLPAPLEMAKNGKVVSSGDYVMLIISGDNDKAVELFNAFVKAQ